MTERQCRAAVRKYEKELGSIPGITGLGVMPRVRTSSSKGYHVVVFFKGVMPRVRTSSSKGYHVVVFFKGVKDISADVRNILGDVPFAVCHAEFNFE